MPSPESQTGNESFDRAAIFHAILARRGLTKARLRKLASETVRVAHPQFGKFSSDFTQIRHPHILQLYGLSQASGYALADWFDFLGIPAGLLLNWQLRFHRDRTILLPAETFDSNAQVPFLGAPVRPDSLDFTLPFELIAPRSATIPVRHIEKMQRSSFLYVRIGQGDVLSRLHFASGAFLRVDPGRTSCDLDTTLDRIHLVQHGGGLSCCRIQPIGRGRILLGPPETQSVFPALHLGTEALILGTVDAEIHLLHASPATIARPLKGFSRPLPAATAPSSLGDLIRWSRLRLGLGLREAQRVTVDLANFLNDDRYRLSASALSAMETENLIPRHIEKILAVCTACCVGLWSYFRYAGLPVENAGQLPFPVSYRSARLGPAAQVATMDDSSRPALAERLITLIHEIPMPLRDVFPIPIGDQQITARDLYWVGATEHIYHPLLANALLLAADPRSVRPLRHPVTPNEPQENPQ